MMSDHVFVIYLFDFAAGLEFGATPVGVGDR
jgi:hypothetical protein